MKQAGNILSYVIILINLYSSNSQDCPGLDITRIARNDIDISWNRTCFNDATSYLVKVTVNPDIGSVDCNDTIVCDGESLCSKSIRSIGCGSYIDPCDSVIMEVMADGNTESVSSNIAPYLRTSDWKLEKSTITDNILTARWGPPDNPDSSEVSCATKTRVTATCPGWNDDNFKDVEVSGPAVQGTVELDLINSNCSFDDDVTLTLTYTIGDILTDTTRDSNLKYKYRPAPGAPTVTDITGNDDTPTNLTVTWEKPTTPIGAENVTGYTITASPGGTSVDVDDPDAVTHELTSLTACTDYTVSVAAKWSNGTGESGNNTGTTGSQAPGKPSNVKSKSTKREISVSWNTPNSIDSCPITSYTVTWTPGNGSGTTADETPSYTITNLTRNTEYTIAVTANAGDKNYSASDPNFLKTINLYGGEIAGIVCGCIVGVALIIGGIFFCYKKKKLCFEI